MSSRLDEIDAPPADGADGAQPTTPHLWGRSIAALVGAVALLVASIRWGATLTGGGSRLFSNAAPFHGTWRFDDHAAVLVPALIAVAIVALWPTLVRRLAWPAMLAASTVLSFVWAASLAATDGVARIWEPLTSRYEYLRVSRRIDGLGGFVSTLVERLPSYPTHVRGHPPGMVIVFWVFDRLGMDAAAIGFVVLVVGATATPAALIALDRIGGRDVARRAAPFVGLAASAMWASTADAVYMAVAAWTTAFAALAVTTAGARCAHLLAATAGLGVGTLAGFTYGAPALLGPFAAVVGWALWNRRWSLVGTIAAGAVVVPLALALAGFWWFDGFAATRHEYWKGFAKLRPYGYFAVANIAVLAASVGPAAIAGLGAISRHRGALLVGGAVAGAIVADLSGYSKGEVERIWLPLTPFLVIATGWLPDNENVRRVALAAQLSGALVLQSILGSPW